MMKLELFQTEQEKDRTPGALLFFAALYDPPAITALRNLITEFKVIRSLTDGSEHMDFQSLRQRLLVCISSGPALGILAPFFLSHMHSSLPFHNMRPATCSSNYSLMKCIECMTERIYNKFQKLHATWTQSRARLFSSRGQTGGDADGAYCCPLCSHDSRVLRKTVGHEVIISILCIQFCPHFIILTALF